MNSPAHSNSAAPKPSAEAGRRRVVHGSRNANVARRDAATGPGSRASSIARRPCEPHVPPGRGNEVGRLGSAAGDDHRNAAAACACGSDREGTAEAATTHGRASSGRDRPARRRRSRGQGTRACSHRAHGRSARHGSRAAGRGGRRAASGRGAGAPEDPAAPRRPRLQGVPRVTGAADRRGDLPVRARRPELPHHDDRRGPGARGDLRARAREAQRAGD